MEWKIRQTQIQSGSISPSMAGAGPHLAHVHALVPLVDELDGQGPVILPRGVSHCEPLVLNMWAMISVNWSSPYLSECVWPRAEDVPVAEADPGHLQQQSEVRGMFCKILNILSPEKNQASRCHSLHFQKQQLFVITPFIPLEDMSRVIKI